MIGNLSITNNGKAAASEAEVNANSYTDSKEEELIAADGENLVAITAAYQAYVAGYVAANASTVMKCEANGRWFLNTKGWRTFSDTYGPMAGNHGVSLGAWTTTPDASSLIGITHKRLLGLPILKTGNLTTIMWHLLNVTSDRSVTLGFAICHNDGSGSSVSYAAAVHTIAMTTNTVHSGVLTLPSAVAVAAGDVIMICTASGDSPQSTEYLYGPIAGLIE